MDLRPAHERLLLSATLLVCANLATIGIVLWHGFDLASLLLIFWLETVVVGFFTLLKMVTIMRSLLAIVMGILAGLYFVIHFTVYLGIHLVGLSVLTALATGMELAENPVASAIEFVRPFIANGHLVLPVLIPVLGFYISHGVSYVVNFVGRGEWRQAKPGSLMTAPYVRLFSMHLLLFIALGGMILLSVLFSTLTFWTTYGPIAVIITLGVVKTLLDLQAHVREHRRLAGTGA